LKRLSLIGVGAGSLNGSISDGAGTIGLYKAGSSSWFLTASNSYSGATDVMGGVLTIANGNALGSGAGSTTIANGANETSTTMHARCK
jgi:autotransporter-associated beta strand protein